MREEFLRVRGLRVHVIRSGDERLPRLLLVHGLGGSVESWVDVLDHLSRGFHLIAVDLPGYGQSEKPDASYTIESFADFVCALIEQLKAGSLILAGHSMGGMIAMKTYSKCPEKVKAMILIDAAGVSGTAAEKIRRYMSDGWTLERLRKFYLDCVLGRVGKLDEARLEEVVQMMEDPGFRRAYLRSLEAISKPLPEEEIMKIKVPTLIIWGSDDKLTPPEDGVKLNKLIRGSRLVIVEGAGHSPQEETPRKLVQEIEKFASKL